MASVSGLALDAGQQRPTRSAWTTSLSRWVGRTALLFGALLACVYIADPAEQSWGVEGLPALKYLPVALCLGSTPWLLFSNGRALKRAPASFFSLMAASSFVLGGAAYSIFALGAPFADSFLGRALPMLVLVPAYLVGSWSRSRTAVASKLWLMGLILSVAMFLGLFAWQALSIHYVDRPHVYHEQIFLPAAAAVAAFTWRDTGPVLRWTIIVVCLAAGVISMKNTGFLATGLAASWLSLVTWRSGAKAGVIKAARNAALIFGLTVAVLTALGLALRSPESLPTGTPELRLVSYPTRLLEFSESPLYGRGFVGSPFLEIGDRLVQSHSDLLDILAFGGALGALLLVLPLAALLLRVPYQARLLHNQHRAPEMFVLFLFPFILVEALVNPVWHQPSIMILFWISVGFNLSGPDTNRELIGTREAEQSAR